MTDPRRRRLQRATAILPLALLSVAATASLASPQSDRLATVNEAGALPEPGSLPDGSRLPDEAIEAPASLSSPSRINGGGFGARQAAVRNASTNDIPAAALAAYQRAETVVNAADESCRIPWQLIAAVGKVESDHGRYGGNVLDDEGLARPGIIGIPLTGSGGTARITDTDAGQFDDDRQFDRAVGPMQFIPSTWAVVGVDADGDGERNPQDIDDAALATGVYLCSGDDDLSERAGQRAAVFRYNNSDSYVDLVLSVMDSYLRGDFTSVPTGTSASAPIAPAPALPLAPPQRTIPQAPPPGPPAPGTGTAPVAPSTGGDGGEVRPDPTPDPEPPTPTNPPTPSNPPAPNGGGGAGDTVGGVVGGVTGNLPGGGGGGGGGGNGGGGGADVLSEAEARVRCLAKVPPPTGAALEACIQDLVG